MAILNVSPDSFSDSGSKEPKFFIKQIDNFIKNEVDIIDIGAQSTKPKANQISTQEEIDRLGPVLEYLNETNLFKEISLDTTRSQVVKRSFQICPSISIINDISGGRFDSEIINTAINHSCKLVITHSKGDFMNLHKAYRYKDVTAEIKNNFNQQVKRAVALGLNNQKIILDPGIGFSKQKGQNIEIIKNLNSLTDFPFPVLISLSRKNFISHLTNEPTPNKRDGASNLLNFWAMTQAVSIIRTHDPKGLNIARKIYLSLI